jgi:tRNA-Thr(GGU) m(6)t(6)A37 methyltransferase TsaA
MQTYSKNQIPEGAETDAAITLNPIGFVRSEIKESMLGTDEEGLSLKERTEKVREKHKKLKKMVSELIIKPELNEILDGIEGFSHILVLYWPHLIPPERRELRKVHPMGRKDVPKQGIFATCSPARPNPILVTAIKLLERKENVLKVQGFEALDGSPILDIKPYNPGYYRIDNPSVPEWMEKFHREFEDKE